MKELEDGCKNFCDNNDPKTRDAYLCAPGGRGPDQAMLIKMYGFDPCSGDNITIDSVLDPTGEKERLNEQEAQNFKRLLPVIVILAIVVIVGLYFMFKK